MSKNKFENAKWKKFNMDDRLQSEMSTEGLMEVEELDDEDTIRLLKQMGVAVPESLLQTGNKRQKMVEPEEKLPVERVWQIGATPEVEATLPELSAPWAEIVDQLELCTPLVQAIRALDFKAPTRIQADCIPPAVMHRADIVGAAETGSGKTLAFAIPVVQAALHAYPDHQPTHLQAIVILPSRELAQQVSGVFKKLTMFAPHLRTVTIVGGLSEEKQKRQLKQQPTFAIGTPGRLLALMREAVSEDKDEEGNTVLTKTAGLSDLSGIRSLVLDEADRLIEAGHFRELDDILAEVYKATNAAKTDKLQTFIFSATLALDQKQGRGLGLGAKDSDVLTHNGKGSNKKKDDVAKKGPVTTGDRVAELMRRVKLRERKLHVCSLEKGSALDTASSAVDGADATSASSTLENRKVNLPATLTLECMQVLEKDRELHLATYLLHAASLAVASGKPWRCLLFVNAITYARRLEPILKIFLGQTQFTQGKSPQAKGFVSGSGVPSLLAVGQSIYISSMHAQMQQKQRLSRLERFKNAQVSLLICTDVAARGLDLPKVDVVFMLQPPRDGPTFVHRAGRTARANQPGTCVCMVIPDEVSGWESALSVVGREIADMPAPMESVSVSAGSLSVIRNCFHQALEVDKMAHSFNKDKHQKDSMRAMAEAADLVWDEDEDKDKDGWKAIEKAEENAKLHRKVNSLLQGLTFPADRVFPAVRPLAEAAVKKKQKMLAEAQAAANAVIAAGGEPAAAAPAPAAAPVAGKKGAAGGKKGAAGGKKKAAAAPKKK